MLLALCVSLRCHTHDLVHLDISHLLGLKFLTNQFTTEGRVFVNVLTSEEHRQEHGLHGNLGLWCDDGKPNPLGNRRHGCRIHRQWDGISRHHDADAWFFLGR